MNGKKWNNNEIEKLKYLYEIKGLACKEISEIIERPYFGIRKKIVVLGLKHTKEQEYEARSRSKVGENNGMYGKETWIKGKTVKSSKRLKNGGKKISKKIKERYKNGFDTSGKNNGMYGKIPWSKGLTKSTDIRLKNASVKISKKIKENWKNLSEDEKERRRKRWALEGLKCNKKNTSIELKIKNFLEENNIEFKQQYNIGRFIVDFYLEKYNLVIECLGDYWHGNPLFYKNDDLNKTQKNNIDRDNRKVELLEKRSIDYIFLWENDIKSYEIKKLLQGII